MSFWQNLGSGVGAGLGGLLFGGAVDALGFGSSGDRSGQAQRLGVWAQIHAAQQKQYNDWAIESARRSLDYNKDVHNWRMNPIQNLVGSATQAGIHPLYALGASQSLSPVTMPGIGSPGSVIPGQADSGDWAKQSMMDIGSAMGGKMLRRQRKQADELHRAQILGLNASAARDEAAAAASFATAAKTIQAAGGDPGAISNIMGETTTIGPESGAQAVSDEYGDAIGEAHGLSKYVSNRAKQTRKRHQRYKELTGKRHPDAIRYSTGKVKEGPSLFRAIKSFFKTNWNTYYGYPKEK